MKLLKFLTAATAILLLVSLCALITSIWKPLMCGKVVYWSMSTGNLEENSFFLGFPVRTNVLPSETESLFDQDASRQDNARLLLFKHSALQPPRAKGSNSKMLTLARGICRSHNFEMVGKEQRRELATYIRNQDVAKIEAFYASFVENGETNFTREAK